jgi:hypothetical protein
MKILDFLKNRIEISFKDLNETILNLKLWNILEKEMWNLIWEFESKDFGIQPKEFEFRLRTFSSKEEV